MKLSEGVMSGESQDAAEEITCTTSNLAGLPSLLHQGSMEQLRYSSVAPEKGTTAQYIFLQFPNYRALVSKSLGANVTETTNNCHSLKNSKSYYK